MSEIRYEVECRFCATRLGGDSAPEAALAIMQHDRTHPRCALCPERINSANDQGLCNDHLADAIADHEEYGEKYRRSEYAG